MSSRHRLASDEASLRAAMGNVVSLQQDVRCLHRLLREARAAGKESLPVGWRDEEFRGR